MPWNLFWTLVLQGVVGTFIGTILLSFLVYMVGSQIVSLIDKAGYFSIARDTQKPKPEPLPPHNPWSAVPVADAKEPVPANPAIHWTRP